jgi:hypothetical protein
MNNHSISNELRDAIKRLRLGPVLDTLAERIALAEKQEMPLQDFLLLILSDEIARRQTSAARRRADDAGLDPDMVFERWDKTAKVHYDRRVLAELATLRFIEAHRNVSCSGRSASVKRLSLTRSAILPATAAFKFVCIAPTISFGSFVRAEWIIRAML